MAYYAKRLQYGAHDGEEGASFVALVEIAKKKGGVPVMFVLYWRTIQYKYPSENETKMLKLKVITAKEAVERFWPFGEKRGADFPGWKSEEWEKTTSWLYHVAVGGGYERFREGMWVRTGMPAPWSKRRRRPHLQFGNLGQLLHAKELDKSILDDSLSDLEFERLKLETHDEDGLLIEEEDKAEYAELSEKIERIQQEIQGIKDGMTVLRCEMRHKVREMFPNPLGKMRKRDLKLHVRKILDISSAGCTV
ncbi:MAG: hypothetical protein NTV60_02715 [Candidatus Kaiserbacteria bacterium]|nr:hypothetical protein [Candidatus Kaiserbacteria bacterium]